MTSSESCGGGAAGRRVRDYNGSPPKQQESSRVIMRDPGPGPRRGSTQLSTQQRARPHLHALLL